MSPARLVSVRPSMTTSLRAAGTWWLMESMSRVIGCRPQMWWGSRLGGDHGLVDGELRISTDEKRQADQPCLCRATGAEGPD